jgi:predicted molibdopterin-dependent oxidoreductase YjgC
MITIEMAAQKRGQSRKNQNMYHKECGSGPLYFYDSSYCLLRCSRCKLFFSIYTSDAIMLFATAVDGEKREFTSSDQYPYHEEDVCVIQIPDSYAKISDEMKNGS